MVTCQKASGEKMVETTLEKMVRGLEGLSEKVKFEQRSEKQEGAGHET